MRHNQALAESIVAAWHGPEQKLVKVGSVTIRFLYSAESTACVVELSRPQFGADEWVFDAFIGSHWGVDEAETIQAAIARACKFCREYDAHSHARASG